MNFRSLAYLVCEAFLLVFSSGTARAHHGMATYDMSKLVTLKGIVTEFDYVNPHVQIHVRVTGGDGQAQDWVAETNSPAILHRGGWYGTMLKPGDHLTVVGNPLRSGGQMLRLQRLIMADGGEVDPNRAND
jgi:hypothetical protein